MASKKDTKGLSEKLLSSALGTTQFAPDVSTGFNEITKAFGVGMNEALKPFADQQAYDKVRQEYRMTPYKRALIERLNQLSPDNELYKSYKGISDKYKETLDNYDKAKPQGINKAEYVRLGSKKSWLERRMKKLGIEKTESVKEIKPENTKIINEVKANIMNGKNIKTITLNSDDFKYDKIELVKEAPQFKKEVEINNGKKITLTYNLYKTIKKDTDGNDVINYYYANQGNVNTEEGKFFSKSINETDVFPVNWGNVLKEIKEKASEHKPEDTEPKKQTFKKKRIQALTDKIGKLNDYLKDNPEQSEDVSDRNAERNAIIGNQHRRQIERKKEVLENKLSSEELSGKEKLKQTLLNQYKETTEKLNELEQKKQAAEEGSKQFMSMKEIQELTRTKLPSLSQLTELVSKEEAMFGLMAKGGGGRDLSGFSDYIKMRYNKNYDAHEKINATNLKNKYVEKYKIPDKIATQLADLVYSQAGDYRGSMSTTGIANGRLQNIGNRIDLGIGDVSDLQKIDNFYKNVIEKAIINNIYELDNKDLDAGTKKLLAYQIWLNSNKLIDSGEAAYIDYMVNQTMLATGYNADDLEDPDNILALNNFVEDLKKIYTYAYQNSIGNDKKGKAKQTKYATTLKNSVGEALKKTGANTQSNWAKIKKYIPGASDDYTKNITQEELNKTLVTDLAEWAPLPSNWKKTKNALEQHGDNIMNIKDITLRNNVAWAQTFYINNGFFPTSETIEKAEKVIKRKENIENFVDDIKKSGYSLK